MTAEYFPYGETWVHNKAVAEQESTPYKFTGKELDPETGLYYYGARYYDGKLSRWTAADPALVKGSYFPKPKDFDTDHDFYWKYEHDEMGKLPGMGGVFNPINVDAYQYAGQNPVKLIDPDGEKVIGFASGFNISTPLGGIRKQAGFAVDDSNNVYVFTTRNLTIGVDLSYDGGIFYSDAKNGDVYFKQQYITLEGGAGPISIEAGSASSSKGADYYGGFSLSKGFKFIGGHFNFVSDATSTTNAPKVSDPKVALDYLYQLKDKKPDNKIINDAIKYYENKIKK